MASTGNPFYREIVEIHEKQQQKEKKKKDETLRDINLQTKYRNFPAYAVICTLLPYWHSLSYQIHSVDGNMKF